tara:strand:+ start:8005 stop:8220 length:216 start_codon:yes stop_codon:yes gene_type:complete
MANRRKSQLKKILNHLQKVGYINPLQALNKYGCFRLSAVIYSLREAGHNIITKNMKNKHGNNYARYEYDAS